MEKIKPFILIILDGWGLSPSWGGNAISMAETPNMDRYWAKFQHTELKASGEAVGLPSHEMGNSEVGHLTIGTGRIIHQDVSRITEAIENKSFFKNSVLRETLEKVKKNNTALHLVGLVSDGGVHSHIKHLFALLESAKKYKLKKVYIHAFSDGRDTPPTAALSFFAKLRDKIQELNLGKIVTVSGRYYAMDRDKHWDRTEKVYQAMVAGVGLSSRNPLHCISQSYSAGKTDEFIIPTLITSDGKPEGIIQDGDTIIFFNFRADRIRQLVHVFVDENFQNFKRVKKEKLNIVSMVPYDYDYDQEIKVIFSLPSKIKNCLSEVLSKNNLRQLHIAETEKYAHVTYFFNGGREKPFPGEDRILVPSSRVATYDLKPEMSAPEVCQKVIDNLTKYDFIVVNFANPDMVGHTGNMQATINALETVDSYLGKIAENVQKQKGLTMICADHGNAEELIDPVNSEPNTEHTSNLVPFILIDVVRKFQNLHPGGLVNIAATILDTLGITKPSEMEQRTLFEIDGRNETKTINYVV